MFHRYSKHKSIAVRETRATTAQVHAEPQIFGCSTRSHRNSDKEMR
jgi:hypothetical protein